MRLVLPYLLCGLLAPAAWGQWLPPASRYDLRQWKLQLPGPVEVKNLNGYASPYFALSADGAMCFTLDAAEPGASKNSTYVRAELRHLSNWSITAPHQLTLTVKARSSRPEYQVTVAQIHGVTAAGDNAPPLLRVALVNGDLLAYVKADTGGAATRKVLLLSHADGNYHALLIAVANQLLTVVVDGQTKLRQDVSFWPYANYFKVGCYPQAHAGQFQVWVKELNVL